MRGNQVIAGDSRRGVDSFGVERAGDWMQMNSGIAFWPLDPRPAEVLIEDIAHSLSLLCRFGGHCRSFYSVAEHSVHVSRLCPPEHRLWGLLHDASEAYVIDMPRPLKRCLPDYGVIEDRVHRAVAARFDLSPEIPASVKQADEAMLLAEAWQLIKIPPLGWSEAMGGVAPADVQVECLSPEAACSAFLHEFHVLMAARG